MTYKDYNLYQKGHKNMLTSLIKGNIQYQGMGKYKKMPGWIIVLMCLYYVGSGGLIYAQDIDIDKAMELRYLGNQNASVTMTEYSSFTCPHCKSFHAGALKKIKEQYINTGKVRYTIVDFPLDGMSLGASMLSRCVDPKRYFAFVELVFERQDKWTSAQDANHALGQLATWAGLSQEKAKSCVQNQALIDAILAKRQASVDQYQISSTPSILINGTLVERGANFEDIQSLIDDALDQ